MTAAPGVRAANALRRPMFDDEHIAFRDSFRRFLDREVVPHEAEWQRAGIVARDVFRQAGTAGFLAPAVPEEYGGAGVDDFRFNVIMSEEGSRSTTLGFGAGIALHNNVALPYILADADAEQSRRWLPGIV